MRASQAFILALASFAVADTTGCGDTVDDAIDACLSPAIDAYNACSASDRGCRCGLANAVIGCYGGCTVASGRQDWVNTAATECRGVSTSASGSSTRTSTDTLTTTPTGDSASTATAAPSATPTGDESSATVIGVALPGFLAAFFGVLAFI